MVSFLNGRVLRRSQFECCVYMEGLDQGAVRMGMPLPCHLWEDPHSEKAMGRSGAL